MGDQLLTVKQAAQRLGLREKTIRRWVALRKIEYVKAGEKAVRISEDEINRIIESGTVRRISKAVLHGDAGIHVY